MNQSMQTGALAAIGDGNDEHLARLRQQLNECTQQFRSTPVTPLTANAFERELQKVVVDFAREVLQDEFNRVETAEKSEAPPRFRYHKETYRINKRTKATIDTSFGSITVWSFLYLCEEDGEPGLHPLHEQLGLELQTTTVLAERVGRWAVDHSQREVRRLLLAEHGVKWSNDRLRRVLRSFRRRMSAHRLEVQVERVLQWLAAAQSSRGRNRPVLVIGRDGVMVPIRGGGYQEASTGTVSVHDRKRRRLGTVYLGCMPEAGQTTLNSQLTELVTKVLERWDGPLPRLAYVTDKGKVHDTYWRKLKRMRHPRDGKRLAWEWVLDFFHACSYVSKMWKALFGETSKQGYKWFRRMRHWLRDRRGGIANILRSATQHFHRRCLSSAAQDEFWKAYNYLRRHRRLMDYERYRREGLPIGSGVTEAACKTVFTQRLKRSGMRWHKESAQVIVDLRVLHLSGIWDEIVECDLCHRPTVEWLPRRSERSQQRKNRQKAA